jgi:hypothetical protein
MLVNTTPMQAQLLLHAPLVAQALTRRVVLLRARHALQAPLQAKVLPLLQLAHLHASPALHPLATGAQIAVQVDFALPPVLTPAQTALCPHPPRARLTPPILHALLALMVLALGAPLILNASFMVLNLAPGQQLLIVQIVLEHQVGE